MHDYQRFEMCYIGADDKEYFILFPEKSEVNRVNEIR